MECKKFDTITLMSYFSGDFDSMTSLRIKNHIKECTLCSSFIATLEKEKTDFLDKFPEPKLPVLPARIKRSFLQSRSVLALAASLLLIVSAGYFTFNRGSADGYRIKGVTQVEIIVQDKNGIPVKRSDNVYYPGEKIQFTYSCGANRYFMLLSTDTSGTVSVFYPAGGDSSIELEAGRDLPLPNSITLDNYVGPELYLAVFSALPLHVAHVKEKLKGSLGKTRGLDSLNLNIGDAEVRTVYIIKQERRQ